MQKLFRFASFAIISIIFVFSLLVVSTRSEALVKGWTPSDLEEGSLSSDSNGDNPLGIVIEPSVNDQNDVINKSNYPDLGSEQVFPFEPGLGNGA